MKKKVLTVLLTGAMVASMAAGATVVSAEDNDNTLTVWAWDQNFNIKSMQIAADQYAADHEGFSVDIIETSSDDCRPSLLQQLTLVTTAHFRISFSCRITAIRNS